MSNLDEFGGLLVKRMFKKIDLFPFGFNVINFVQAYLLANNVLEVTDFRVKLEK